MDPYKVDTFTRAYLEAALWSSTDESTPEGGEPMDLNFSIEDIAEECLERMVADCKKFQEDLSSFIGNSYAEAGHDFWLTRNRHGAGFWDGDWGPIDGNVLTEASHEYGEFTLYVGDDGKIYGM